MLGYSWDQHRSGLLAVLVLVVFGVAPLGAEHGVAKFADVSASEVHAPGIAALATEGVLDGTECGDGMFCPAGELRRWVMAVWLVRALDGGDPASGSGSRFGDVDAGDWWAPHAERLADLGITAGCLADPPLYCPHDVVTRGQAASLLVRAFDLAGAREAGFVDTTGSPHAAGIDSVAAAGITAGCSVDPLRYCPNRQVTRGQMATFMARAKGWSTTPEPSDATEPVQQLIAYNVTTGASTGPSEVWVTNPDGTDRIKLTDGGGFHDWSPNGRRIAYQVQADAGVEYWVANADGTNPTKLTNGLFLQWSPSGQHIAYYVNAGAGKELWIAEADGTDPTKLTDHTGYWGWSPDGRRIAYRALGDAGDEVWVANVDGSDPTKLTDGLFLQWSPNGQQIAYRVYASPDWAGELWVANADGAGAIRLTNHGEPGLADHGHYGGWSPDGGHIAFHVRGDNGVTEVRLANTDGANPIQLTPDGRFLGWSPGGKHIAYEARGDNGVTGVWVAEPDGANRTRLTDDGSGARPLWSPTGQQIAYQVNDPTAPGWPKAAIWVANTDGANPIELTRDGWFGGWSPDGQALAYVETGTLWIARADGSDRTEIIGWYFLGWSPDGRHLAYTADTGAGQELWIARADGSDPVKIADNFGNRGVWSPG